MKCEVSTFDSKSSFDDLYSAMQTQQYWVRFFMRPCCPPPGEASARNQIEHLKDDIDARDDFSDSERLALQEVIDSRLEWYLKLGVRHTA